MTANLELVGVKRFAGKLTMRESAAILAQADLHIGPDSLLMHMANGVDDPCRHPDGGLSPSRNVWGTLITLTLPPFPGLQSLLDSPRLREPACTMVECMKRPSTVEVVLEAVEFPVGHFVTTVFF